MLFQHGSGAPRSHPLKPTFRPPLASRSSCTQLMLVLSRGSLRNASHRLHIEERPRNEFAALMFYGAVGEGRVSRGEGTQPLVTPMEGIDCEQKRNKNESAHRLNIASATRCLPPDTMQIASAFPFGDDFGRWVRETRTLIFLAFDKKKGNLISPFLIYFLHNAIVCWRLCNFIS